MNPGTMFSIDREYLDSSQGGEWIEPQWPRPRGVYLGDDGGFALVLLLTPPIRITRIFPPEALTPT